MNDIESDLDLVKWSLPVRQDKIRRLYETDASGLVDEALIDDVGYALYLRCRSILDATEAHHGRVKCPRCQTLVLHHSEKDALLVCSQCHWQVTWGAYHKTYQGRSLYGGGAIDVFREFIRAFDRARTPRQKLLAIDRAIHTFHCQMSAVPTAPAARNIIEGSLSSVLAFLDTLTYGDAGTPELRSMRAGYEETKARSMVAGRGAAKK